MSDVREQLRTGVLDPDLVGLAAELGDPAARAAIDRPPAADAAIWVSRMREALESRVPADDATAAEWEAAEVVLRAQAHLEILLAMAACRGLAALDGTAAPPAALARALEVMAEALNIDDDSRAEHGLALVRELDRILDELGDPATGLAAHLFGVLRAVRNHLMRDIEPDVLRETTATALDLLGTDRARDALRAELAPWLLDPHGAPHPNRPSERAPPPPSEPSTPAWAERVIRERILRLPEARLVHVLIGAAEVELYESALSAEDAGRAEAALAAARDWMDDPSPHTQHEAYLAGREARHLLAGPAATACARFRHLAAQTAVEALAALPPGEVRTMVYRRLAELLGL